MPDILLSSFLTCWSCRTPCLASPVLGACVHCLNFLFCSFLIPHSARSGPGVPHAWQAQSLVHVCTVLISYFARSSFRTQWPRRTPCLANPFSGACVHCLHFLYCSFLIPHAVALAYPMPGKPSQWCVCGLEVRHLSPGSTIELQLEEGWCQQLESSAAVHQALISAYQSSDSEASTHLVSGGHRVAKLRSARSMYTR